MYEQGGERWEVAVAVSDNGFQQMSFVNSIATTKGGRHVDHVSKLIENNIAELVKKKNKGGIVIKPHQIRNHMWIFINCLIVNPSFDSQTKENMTLAQNKFGSKCSLTPKFFTQLSKVRKSRGYVFIHSSHNLNYRTDFPANSDTLSGREKSVIVTECHSTSIGPELT